MTDDQLPHSQQSNQKEFFSYKRFIDDLHVLLMDYGMTKPDLADHLLIDINCLDRILSVTCFLKRESIPKDLYYRARYLRNVHRRRYSLDESHSINDRGNG